MSLTSTHFRGKLKDKSSNISVEVDPKMLILGEEVKDKYSHKLPISPYERTRKKLGTSSFVILSYTPQPDITRFSTNKDLT